MDYLFHIVPVVAVGLQITLKIFIITIVLSLPLGILMAIGRISKIAILRKAMYAYIYVMRGTPLMLQILFIYYGLPFIIDGLKLPAFPAAIIAFVLNYAAYFAEIFRGGIQSIDRGQYEGAKVLGMTYVQTMRRIILPQVIKRILPSVTNEVITLVKDTSLAFTLSVAEMFSIAKALAASQTNMIPFVAAGLFYYIFNLVVAVGMEWVEKKMDYYR